MQEASSRIWTGASGFISNGDKSYTTNTFDIGIILNIDT